MCNLCASEVKTSGNTTNLWTHLKIKHPKASVEALSHEQSKNKARSKQIQLQPSTSTASTSTLTIVSN